MLRRVDALSSHLLQQCSIIAAVRAGFEQPVLENPFTWLHAETRPINTGSTLLTLFTL